MPKLDWKHIALFALAAVLPSCDKAPLTAPPTSTIFLQANPTFVIANGGVSVVTAVVVEPAGTYAPDGTEVSFFTTLGRIDPLGKTVNGIASVNFVSDARSGQATLTAISGSVNATLTNGISVGSFNPALVLVTVDPPTISPGRAGQLTATVLDASGNPVQNVPVSFALDSTALDERLESGGGLLYTNSNGQVFDTVRTSAPSGTNTTVTVTATAANGKAGTVTVAVFVP
jgi:adhesin/invasin